MTAAVIRAIRDDYRRVTPAFRPDILSALDAGADAMELLEKIRAWATEPDAQEGMARIRAILGAGKGE